VGAGRSASDAELLDVLEWGDGLSSPERAILLAVAQDRDLDAGILPLGVRNAVILKLRRHLFGPTIEVYDTCVHCREGASLEVSCAALDQVGAHGRDGAFEVRVGTYEIVCRPPTATDLVTAARAESARTSLLESTIVRARRGGATIPAAALPAEVVSEVGRALAEADPLAEIELTATCAACGGSWNTVLDISDFVWQELRQWGRRLLWEVHVLASAYGWPEREILSVPSRRRQAYLGLVLDG